MKMMRSVQYQKVRRILAECALLGMLAVIPAHAATTYTVYKEADSGNTMTLRGCIAAATNNDGPDIIHFDLLAGVTITVHTPLNITEPLLIDGEGQAIVVGSTGSTTGADVFHLLPGSDGSTLTSLAIVSGNNGVVMTSNSNLIHGCRIGLDWTNTPYGLVCGVLDRGTGNEIGRRGYNFNVISDNSTAVLCDASTFTRIANNLIGTRSSGSYGISNAVGVDLRQARYARVGGNRFEGDGNLIAASTQYGVRLLGEQAFGNTVCGNILGTDPNCSIDLGNATGIEVDGARGNWIGQSEIDMDNIIANSTTVALCLERGTSLVSPRDNVVQNNYIGYYPTAGATLGNREGIILSYANSNLIGGWMQQREGNVISQNRIFNARAVWLENAYGNTVSGNYIGTNEDGIMEIPNFSGVGIQAGGGNIIGGTNSSSELDRGNLISGNEDYGVMLSATRDNVVQGNRIGLSQDGLDDLPNWGDGLLISNCPNRNRIGGVLATQANVISNNLQHGVHLVASRGQELVGNRIGTNAPGDQVMDNQNYAVYAENTSGCMVGGTAAGAGNIICDTERGMEWDGSPSFGNTIVGNWIGVLSDHSLQPTPFAYGIYFNSNVFGNFVGLSYTAQGNLICGASQDNIYLNGTGGSTNHNGLFGNTLTAAGGQAIRLANSANDGQTPPQITTCFNYLISGSSGGSEYIEVFLAEPIPSQAGGSLQWLGATQADTGGQWDIVPSGAMAGSYVCALATDGNNTSEFCINVPLTTPTPSITPTCTISPTISPTPTLSPTPSISHTPTQSPVVSPTPTSTRVVTSTWTITLTATISPTPTRSPSGTISPTSTQTLTRTPSPTRTPTNALAMVAWETGRLLAYPNPARETMYFLLHAEAAVKVEIWIYNSQGECVSVLRKSMPAGRGQRMEWDCRNVSAGVYLARVFMDTQTHPVIKLAVVR